jgi:hypothetical protein
MYKELNFRINNEFKQSTKPNPYKLQEKEEEISSILIPALK